MSHSDFKAFQKSTQRSFVYDSLISQRGPEGVRASPEGTQPVSGRIVSWIHLLAHWTFSFSLGPFPILPSVLPDILFTESHRNPGDRQDRVSQSCVFKTQKADAQRGFVCYPVTRRGRGKGARCSVHSTTPPPSPVRLHCQRPHPAGPTSIPVITSTLVSFWETSSSSPNPFPTATT